MGKLVWMKVATCREVLVDEDTLKIHTVVSAAPSVRREHLTLKERRSLKIQTGKDITTRSELEAHMRANDLRFVETNETQDRMRREREQWMRDTKRGQRGPLPFRDKIKYGPV